MKNIFNVTTVLPHNLLQTNSFAFVTTFRYKSSESAQHNFTMWALSCAPFCGHLWNTSSFKNPHKKKSHGLISGLWGGLNLPLSWRSGNRCDITTIKRLIQEIKNHVCSVWTGSILHEPLCVYRETCCQKMEDETVFQHVLLSFFGDGVIKGKWTDDSVGWNCGPHINFCSIIFFLMQCVRRFPRPESNVLFIDNTI